MANHMINKFNNGPQEFKNIRKYNMFFQFKTLIIIILTQFLNNFFKF